VDLSWIFPAGKTNSPPMPAFPHDTLKRFAEQRGWRLVGVKAFLDLKKREQRSLMALSRDTYDLQPFNSVVIRMLGFPTSNERLLAWLRSKGALAYKEIENKSENLNMWSPIKISLTMSTEMNQRPKTTKSPKESSAS
jgi:hypothetical protein